MKKSILLILLNLLMISMQPRNVSAQAGAPTSACRHYGTDDMHGWLR